MLKRALIKGFDYYIYLKMMIDNYINPYDISEIYIYINNKIKRIYISECYMSAFSKTKQYVIFKHKNKYYVRFVKLYRLVDLNKHIINDYHYVTLDNNNKIDPKLKLMKLMASQGLNIDKIDNIVIKIEDHEINVPLLIQKNEIHYRQNYKTDINIFLIFLIVLNNIKVKSEIHEKIAMSNKPLLESA